MPSMVIYDRARKRVPVLIRTWEPGILLYGGSGLENMTKRNMKGRACAFKCIWEIKESAC